MRGLSVLGVEVSTLDLDTAVAAYLVDPAESQYLLEDLAARYAGIELRSPDAPPPGQLDLGGGELTIGHERLGQDEASRRVLRIPREPVAAERHGVTRPSGLAIEVGQLREGEGSGIPRQPLLLSADGADDRLIFPGHPKRVIRSRSFRCQPCLRRHDAREAITARTSAVGTS